MNPNTLHLDTNLVLRDLAAQFAQGLLSTHQYLDLMESVCRTHAHKN